MSKSIHIVPIKMNKINRVKATVRPQNIRKEKVEIEEIDYSQEIENKNEFKSYETILKDTKSKVSKKVETITNNVEGIQNFFDGIKEKAHDMYQSTGAKVTGITKNVENIGKKVGATAVNVGLSVTKGIVNLGEGLVDGVQIISKVKETPYLAVADGINYVGSKATNHEYHSILNNAWESTRKNVAYQATDTLYNKIYGTKAGKAIDESAYLKREGTACKIVEGVSTTASIIVASIFTGGVAAEGAVAGGVVSSAASSAGIAAGIAGVKGVGEGSEEAFQNKDVSTIKGVTYGLANGAYEGLQYYFGAKIGNALPIKEGAAKGLNSLFHIGFDAVDGGSEGFIRPLLKRIYEDKSYGELFLENGGMEAVLTGATVGGFTSFLGEGIDASGLTEKLFSKLSHSNVDITENLMGEYNSILSQNPALSRYMYLQDNYFDPDVPLDLQNDFSKLVHINNKIKELHPELIQPVNVTPNETIVISDLHGDLSRFEFVKQKLNLNPNAKIFIEGDAMDRGNYGVEILLQIKEMSDSGKVQYIPGNHDLFAYNFLRGLQSGENNATFQNALGNLQINGGKETVNQLINFDQTVQNAINNVMITKPITRNELTSWLGNQPIQCLVQENGQNFALAHALFDASLYQKDAQFNLAKAYDIERSGKDSNIYNQFLNVMWYRKGDANTHYAPLSIPKDYTMVVGHTPQKSVNVQQLSDSIVSPGVFVDSGKADHLNGYNLTTGKDVNFLEIYNEFNARVEKAKIVNAKISQSKVQSVLLDQIQPSSATKASLAEKFFSKFSQKPMNSVQDSVSNVVETKPLFVGDEDSMNFLENALNKRKTTVTDPNVKAILSHLDQMPQIKISKNDIGVTKCMKVSHEIAVGSDVLATQSEGDVVHEFGHALHNYLDGGQVPIEFSNVMKSTQERISSTTSAQLIEMISLDNIKVENTFNHYKNGFGNELKSNMYLENLNSVKKMDSDTLIQFLNENHIDVEPQSQTFFEDVANFKTEQQIDLICRGFVKNEHPDIAPAMDIISSTFASSKLPSSVTKGQPIRFSMCHSDSYFKNDYKRYAEQVANYFDLKANNHIQKIEMLHQILGEDWYQMMESQMKRIADKLGG